MFRVGRRFRPAAGAALLAAIVLLAGCDWPQSRFGPDHTGFNPSETTISRANVSGLQLRWSAPLGGGSAPVVAGGALYVSSGKLYALDAGTGSARWSSQGLGDVITSPAVAGGLVYVGGLKDGNGWLYAVDAASGAARWSQNLGNGWPTAPTVVNGVAFATGDQLYAFNATTGARLWSAATGDEEYFNGSPTVAEGVAYVGGNKLYAYNAATGARLWSTASFEDFFYSPAVARGVVYVGSHAGLAAFDAATGRRLWSAEPGVGTNEAPAVANGVVYIGADQLYAFNAATGAQLWSAGPPSGVSSPVVANGVVYAGRDQIHAFDATTGARLWSAGASNASPIVANGVLYGMSNLGLSAYGLPGGPPQLSMSPAFPHEFVFGAPGSRGRTFTITNLGSTPTSSVTASLSGPDAAHFRRTSDGCTGSVLAGRASCTVTISFTPTRSGPRTAWLTASATSGGAVRSQLIGTAQPFTLSPPVVYFGELFAGATLTGAFTVTNLTDKAVGQLTNSITPAAGFSLVNDACAGKLIAPAASCTFSVRFAPTAGVPYLSTLVATVPGYEARAPLAGNGRSRLTITPESKSFGHLAPGTSVSESFTVTNVSPAAVGPITDTVVYLSGPDDFSISADTCAGRSLAPSASCTFVVTFAPTAYGFRQALLRTASPLGGFAESKLLGGL